MDTVIGVITFVALLVALLWGLDAIVRTLGRDWREAPRSERPWLIALVLVILGLG